MCDTAVDKIWTLAPVAGASIIKANFPKAFVDLNRSLDDIEMQCGLENWQYGFKKKTCYSYYDRLFKTGIVHPFTKEFTTLSLDKLNFSEADKRVKNYYLPYRENLKSLILGANVNNGVSIHISCHSMRSTPTNCPGDLYDVIIGDHNGNSCDPNLSRLTYDFFMQSGYQTAMNYKFNGGDLINYTKNPKDGFHSLQIEFSKRLYLQNQDNILNKPGLFRLQLDCKRLVKRLGAYLLQEFK